MKKILALILAMTMVFAMAACSSSSNEDVSDDTVVEDTTVEDTAPETVTVSVQNADSEWIDLEVPYYPTRIVFIDYVALDLCAALGILDNPDVEFLTIQSSLGEYLQSYIPEGSPDLGGLKEYDMEAIMSFEPDIIFTSGRTMSAYDEFSIIAPTVCTSLTYEPSTFESFKTINTRNASIFGLEDECLEIINSYTDRLEALQAWADGQTAALTLFTGGAMTTNGNSSRTSMITNDLGFLNVAADVDATHGVDASYEALLEINPDYIFVLDRDSAISAEGASTAAELLDNAIIHETSAWQNGNIVYLDPVVWYQHEGGLMAMDIMLSDLEVGMNAAA